MPLMFSPSETTWRSAAESEYLICSSGWYGSETMFSG